MNIFNVCLSVSGCTSASLHVYKIWARSETVRMTKSQRKPWFGDVSAKNRTSDFQNRTSDFCQNAQLQLRAFKIGRPILENQTTDFWAEDSPFYCGKTDVRFWKSDVRFCASRNQARTLWKIGRPIFKIGRPILSSQNFLILRIRFSDCAGLS